MRSIRCNLLDVQKCCMSLADMLWETAYTDHSSNAKHVCNTGGEYVRRLSCGKWLYPSAKCISQHYRVRYLVKRCQAKCFWSLLLQAATMLYLERHHNWKLVVQVQPSQGCLWL